MIVLRWTDVKLSEGQIKPPSGSRANAVIFGSISAASFTGTAVQGKPADAAPVSMDRRNEAKYGAVFGLNRTATRASFGAISFRISIHFPPIENSKAVNPVRFPPGCAKFETKLLGLWVAIGALVASAPGVQAEEGRALHVTDNTARHLRYTSRAKREADVSLSHRRTMEHHDASICSAMGPREDQS